MKSIFPVKLWLVWLYSILILSACASSPPTSGLNNPAQGLTPTQVQPSPTSFPSVAPTVTSPPVATIPPTSSSKLIAPVFGCSQASLQESVILVSWSPQAAVQELIPTDPLTGQPLCELEPIQAGKQFVSKRSPDGKTLALTISNQDEGGDARLHLLDLGNWQLSETPVVFEGWVGQLIFSPDGRRLAVASSGPAQGEQDMLNSTQLTLLDLSSRSVVAETLLDFNSRLIEYLPDGSALVLYGQIQGSNNLTQVDPKAVILEASNLQETWQISLPGILEGQYQEEGIEGPEGLMYWSPGLAFSPASQTLFIVHADADRLTKVDFSSQTISTVKIHRAASWLERLLSLTAGVAHAKILNGTMKTAILSPGGERLYIVGQTYDSWQDSNGEWHIEQELHGLQVIDASSGAEIARAEADSSDLALSPDGAQIYLRGWDGMNAWTQVVDAATLKPLDRLLGYYLVTGWRLDGEPVLLSNVNSEYQTILSILDETSLTEVTKWQVRGYASWLTLP